MLGTISLDKVAGGLEKNIVYLANQLVDEGHTVVLLSFDLQPAKSFYKIDDRVIWIKAGVSQPHARITFAERINLIKNIRLAMTKNEVTKIIVFSHGLLARFMVAGLGLKTMFICSERNSLSMYDFIRQSKWNINFILLALANKITVQFAEYKNQYPFWLRHKITAIHNPIFRPPVSSDLSKKNIIMVGRLTAQKQFDIAIQAFAIVLEQYPDWKLCIVGQGPLESQLRMQVNSLKIAKSVWIRPPSKSIENYFLDSSIYLISSQWEGFPNALAEALSYGLLAVGAKSTAGVANLIDDGQNGILVDGDANHQNVAAAILRLLEQEEDWRRMSQTSKAIADVFPATSWIEKWKDIISDGRKEAQT